MKRIQDKIKEVFKIFGYTPFKQRLDDVFKEAHELLIADSIEHTQEELGDLLSSAIQLANERGWDVEKLIDNTLQKIIKRKEQYMRTGRRINIAIYGGSFDPIHLGHEMAAKIVLDSSRVIDEVWFTPCYKSLYGKDLARAVDRLNMCEMATKTDGRFKTFPYEIEHALNGETYHFIKKLLHDDKYSQFRFYFMMGSDTAISLPNWPNAEYLMNMIPFVIVHRPETKIKLSEAWFLKRPDCIFIESEKSLNIGSTNIRAMIKDGVSWLNKYLRDNVIDYIIKNQLYPKRDFEINTEGFSRIRNS